MATPSGLADCYNYQVALYAAQVNRFIGELVQSTSSGINQFMEYDIERLNAFLNNLEGYIARMAAQAQIDVPQTHAVAVAVESAPDMPDMESLLVREAVQLLLVAREELVNSASRRLPHGITAFDEKRQKAYIEQCRAFLKDYVAEFTPVDTPDTSPSVPMASIE